MTMTIREYLENELCGLGLDGQESEKAVDFAIRNINERMGDCEGVTKDDNTVLIKDCWNTNADDWKEEQIHSLRDLVEFQTLLWCINELHSRE